MKRTILIAAAALLPAMSACNDSLTPPVATQPDAEPTSVMDLATGEPRSKTTMTADREFIMPRGAMPGSGLSAVIMPPPVDCDPSYEICDEPCDPAFQWGCQPCDPTNPEHWCYQPPCTTAPTIASVTTVKGGDEPNHSLEANGTAYYDCGGYLVLVGVGIRLDVDDNIETLWLKYRRLFANGTWGSTELRKYGDEPNGSREAEGEVTEGNAITGIGVGSQYTHNVNTLRIWFRQVALVNGVPRTTGIIDERSYGILQGGTLDTDYKLPLADTHKVYVGLGARGHDHEVKTLHHHIGTLY